MPDFVISEIILFIATNSRACVGCINFIGQNRLPVQIVRLDTQDARDEAASGKFFQITVVPSMVVNYTDGNTQLFLGTEKIIQWLTAIIKSVSPSRESGQNYQRPYPVRDQPSSSGSSQYDPSREAEEDGSMEEIVIEDDLPPLPKPRRVVKKPVIIEDTNEDAEEAEDEEEEKAEPPRPLPRPKAKKVRASAKGKKKKRAPVRFEEDDEYEEQNEIELVSTTSNHPTDSHANRSQLAPPPPRPAPQKPNQSSRMKDLLNSARKMEEDRKNSLGYREEDLPKSL